ncbi:carbon-nitrogen hydrolase family protein [candidate division KSB1 bacterium]|nr:carbon-nitrogen hydrolase family protein [candidate division KSB1 bacterium]
MKICVAQTRPIKGDIQSNIDNHKKLIDLAVTRGADTIIFPELSITGYEPELAKDLATTPDDRRFDDFQMMAGARQITIGIGVPIKNERGICISMLIFQPGRARQTYSKKYLHADEEEFFVSGQSTSVVIGNNTKIAPAICYELSVPEHAENAFRNGAEVYLASVAKSAEGVDKAVASLSGIARKYSMIGACSGFESAGRSAIWNNQGMLLGQLNGAREGILMLDTDTQEIIAKTI